MSVAIAKQPVKDETFSGFDALCPRGGTADATDLKAEKYTPTQDLPENDLQKDVGSSASEKRAKQRERMRIYRATHRETIRAFDRSRKKKYRAGNKKKLSDYAADYYSKNREKLIPQVREWRDNNRDVVNRHTSEWNKRHPQKKSAHLKVYRAVQAGKLIRQPCEVCGERRVHAHHDDYTKPLDVRWLCQKHHPAADAERRRRERDGSSPSPRARRGDA